jgi:hypothetical protein
LRGEAMATGEATRTAAKPSSNGQPRVPQPASRRAVQLPQLAVGLLLVALCALGFVLLYGAGVERTSVLALGADVVRGQQLTLDDLRVVNVGTDDPVGTVAAGGADRLVGRTVVADLPAGTLLVEQMVTEGAELTAGSGVVGLALGPGRYPGPQVTVGDVVEVIEVTDVTPSGRRIATAEIVAVSPVGTQGLQFFSLLLAEDELGLQVAAAAGRDEVHLMQVPSSSERVVGR